MYSLGIIPARGGSKRIPRKNIRDFCGKPLIAWTIEAAMRSRLSEIIVSTDDEEIRTIAQNSGGWAPFLRPTHLATDDATSVDVAIHAASWFSEHRNIIPTAIVLLQPTSPTRTVADINHGLNLLIGGCLESVISGHEKPDGAFYAVHLSCLLQQKTFQTYPGRYFHFGKDFPDIDTEEDWKRAEAMLCK